MISFSTILLFGIFSGLFLFSIWPLLLDKINNDQYDNDTLNDLERRKSILYREIQYLDNEFFVQNMNIDDYNISRAELVREVSNIIDQMNSFPSNKTI